VKNPEPPISAFTPAQLRQGVLSKALAALSVGRITGTEVARVEAGIEHGPRSAKGASQAHFRGRAALESTGRPMAARRRRAREPSIAGAVGTGSGQWVTSAAANIEERLTGW